MLFCKNVGKARTHVNISSCELRPTQECKTNARFVIHSLAQLVIIMLQNSISPSCAPNVSCSLKQCTYHGSCRGVGRFLPIVSSAVPISPLSISTHTFSEGRRQLTRPPGRPILSRLADI